MQGYTVPAGGLMDSLRRSPNCRYRGDSVRRAQNEFLSCLKAGKTGDLHSIADGARHAGLAASAGVG